MGSSDLRKVLARTARRPASWLGLVLFVSIIRGFPYLDFVPIWDAMIYAGCVARATIGDLEFGALNCAGHPSAAYIALLALPVRLFGPHYVCMIGVNLLLGAAALRAFYQILRRQSPGGRDALEIVCMVLMLSFHPLVLTSALSVNPDYGVYCFFLLFLNALQGGRILRTVLWGTCLVFSKEVGTLLFGLAILLQFVVDLRRRRYGFWRWMLRIGAFAIPAFPLGMYFLYRTSPGGEGLWGGVTPKQLVFDHILHFDSEDPAFRRYITQISVLQFAWIAVAIILLGWVRRGLDRLWRLLGHRSTIPRSGLFASVLLLGSVFFLTRFSTFSNVRYFLVLAPMILWVFYESVRAILPWRNARIGVIVAAAALFLLSNYRTIDPLSQWVFGTFNFGAHPMLGLAAYAGECCCQGRDQLGYNIEHTHFHYLQEEVLQDLKPHLRAGDPIVLYPKSYFRNVGPVDRAMRRALPYPTTYEPTVIDDYRPDVVASVVQHGYFVALPNCENPGFLAGLETFFRLTRIKTYDRSGYTIDLYEMQRKD